MSAVSSMSCEASCPQFCPLTLSPEIVVEPFKRLFDLVGTKLGSRSVTARWQGYYEQHNTQRRIIASLQQRGNQLSGSMIDVDNHSEQSLVELLTASGYPPEYDAQIIAEIREQIPDASGKEIRFQSELPESSILEGERNGVQIQFSKHYQGEVHSAYVVGGKSIGFSDPGHSVDYRGQLSADGTQIAGLWSIEDPEFPERSIEGRFKLSRLTDAT